MPLSAKRAAPTAFMLAAVLLVIGLWGLAPTVLSCWAGPEHVFEAVAALFSGLAFVVLIFAVFLQRQELSLQREELRATREEMKLARAESARAAEAQETAARLAAITTLIAQTRERIAVLTPLAEQTAGDANSPSGRQTRIVNPALHEELEDARADLEGYLRDLRRLYWRIAPEEFKEAILDQIGRDHEREG